MVRIGTSCKVNSCPNCSNFRSSYSSESGHCSYHERCLNKLRGCRRIDIESVREIETFETWFNKNCGYAISCDYSSPNPYYVWIIVYEPAIRDMEENLSVIENYNWLTLTVAREEAQKLKVKLQRDYFDDTPMLEVFKGSIGYSRFNSIITDPYVTKKPLPCGSERVGLFQINSFAPRDASDYLKPLDIVWIKRREYNSWMGYYHVGVYIGKWNNEEWMCHLDGDGKGAEIVTWEKFLTNGICEELIRFHPTIPFKNHSKIARQIAWATDGTPFRKGNYNLKDRNCEHFANMIVYGINYSEQIYNKFSSGNNGKGSTIILTDEMEETNNMLGYTNAYHWCAEKIMANIEVPPKQNCQIM